METIKNFTADQETILDADHDTVATFPPQGPVFVTAMPADAGTLAGVPMVLAADLTVAGLPDPQLGVFLLVAADVAYAARLGGRTTDDLLIPATSVCTENGKLIGWSALAYVS